MIIVKQIKDFINEGIWIPDLIQESKLKRILIRLLRILVLAMKGFKQDKLTVRASALTYFTMLSIVPVLALGFGIAKGFGLEAVLEDEIAKNMAGQKEAFEYIQTFTRSMLNTTKGGLIAGIGLGLLMWSVMKLLMSIENAFNTIWEVNKSRAFVRKFTDYFSIMLFAPILMILSSSATVFVTTQMSNLTEGSEMFEFATPMVVFLVRFMPYVIIWLLFTVLYMSMPNTSVNFKSALIAGIIAGTIFQSFQGLYIYFQASASRYNAIYGSFAALPLFLIWLQISWLVVLLGGEISYVIQNVKIKAGVIRNDEISIAYQKKLAVLVTKIIIDRFSKGEKPIQLEEIAQEIKIPVQTANYIVDRLMVSGIISAILIDKNNISYQPAESINNIDVNKVIFAYEKQGTDKSDFINKKNFSNLIKILDDIPEKHKNSAENILIKDIKTDVSDK